MRTSRPGSGTAVVQGDDASAGLPSARTGWGNPKGLRPDAEARMYSMGRPRYNKLIVDFLSSAPAVGVHNGGSPGLLIVEWSRPGVDAVEHPFGAARSVYSKKRTGSLLCAVFNEVNRGS